MPSASEALYSEAFCLALGAGKFQEALTRLDEKPGEASSMSHEQRTVNACFDTLTRWTESLEKSGCTATNNSPAEIKKILQRFLADGLDSNRMSRSGRGQTPLHVAIEIRDPILVKELIRDGAELNQEDEDKITPLHYAAIAGEPKTVQALINGGAEASIDSADCEG